MLSGLYLIAYWVPVLLGGRPDGALAGSITGVSGRLQALVADNVGPLTAVTAVAVGAALVTVLVARLRRRGATPAGADSGDDRACCPTGIDPSESAHEPADMPPHG